MIQNLIRIYTQIVQDFNVRHPSLEFILYERWPKVAKLLIEYAEKSGIDICKKLDIQGTRYDFTEGKNLFRCFLYLI